jgi:hypothetical protein
MAVRRLEEFKGISCCRSKCQLNSCFFDGEMMAACLLIYKDLQVRNLRGGQMC